MIAKNGSPGVKPKTYIRNKKGIKVKNRLPNSDITADTGNAITGTLIVFIIPALAIKLVIT